MSEREAMMGALGAGVVEAMDPELVRAFDLADNTVPQELRDPEKLRRKPGFLKVSGDGVFYTLQGEGTSMGEPAVFIRTQLCNLRCVWCDTPYTWNPKSEAFWTEPQDWSVADTAKKIEDIWGAPKGIDRRVIFTGGEPLLQQETIEQVIDKLEPDWKVEIETNGTITPTDKMMARAQFNCSPKLENSGNAPQARIRKEAIAKMATGNATFKFVVMKPEELDEIEKDYIVGCGISPEQVILMPQGVTAEETQMNMRNVAEYAKEKGYRLLGRLQTEIWGARRKV